MSDINYRSSNGADLVAVKSERGAMQLIPPRDIEFGEKYRVEGP